MHGFKKILLLPSPAKRQNKINKYNLNSGTVVKYTQFFGSTSILNNNISNQTYLQATIQIKHSTNTNIIYQHHFDRTKT